MKPFSKKEIALLFSTGKFAETYSCLSDDIEWIIAGERELIGKPAVIDFCNQTAYYFSSVTTHFQTKNIIEDEQAIAIDGNAVFINNDGKQTRVSSCDVYRFENERLVRINSYCITLNKAQP